MTELSSAAAAPDDLWALRALGGAARLQQWMFSLLRPTQVGPALEIGSGIGTFSELLLEFGMAPLLLVEPEPACTEELARRFGGRDDVTIVAETLPGSEAVRARAGFFRYALCQNVLEHIDDDEAALAEIAAALGPGGELALLVPAHPALFGRLDRRFGHRRRYTRERLLALVAAAGLETVDVRSFNLLGVPGWWIAGRTRLLDMTDRSLAAFDALVPLARPLEDVLRPRLGLSLIVRARRPA
ncbi:MAG TPA: methyltransferase domain-containing protein [Gaiellaceae bacterium]|nr:methyltransferase domain-containing protein [Gaiellaceae bacterium]